jgi:hypothetical protein
MRRRVSPTDIYRFAIYCKLGVNRRPDAVARAETLGLLDTAESPR